MKLIRNSLFKANEIRKVNLSHYWTGQEGRIRLGVENDGLIRAEETLSFVQSSWKNIFTSSDSNGVCVFYTPAMFPWQVLRVWRMSWSSRTAAAASSPQHISGSITTSIRPTPREREEVNRRILSDKENGEYSSDVSNDTGAVQVDERSAPLIVMETFAAVLLKLNLSHSHALRHHLIPLLPP